MERKVKTYNKIYRKIAKIGGGSGGKIILCSTNT